MDSLSSLRSELHSFADPQKAKFYSRFFKTGKGEYAEGDKFIGVIVPHTRIIANRYKSIPLLKVKTLLKSPIHEERLTALLILVYQFKYGNKDVRKQIFTFYLNNTKYINNWDLVDLSADKIVGAYLIDKKDRKILEKFAKSFNVWERRIAIISTFQFIKNNKYIDTFSIAEILLYDKHDLIHKAVGWMLREVGKRISTAKEEEFLKKHYKKMPRTMLRYSIERFDKNKREKYLKGRI